MNESVRKFWWNIGKLRSVWVWLSQLDCSFHIEIYLWWMRTKKVQNFRKQWNWSEVFDGTTINEFFNINLNLLNISLAKNLHFHKKPYSASIYYTLQNIINWRISLGSLWDTTCHIWKEQSHFDFCWCIIFRSFSGEITQMFIDNMKLNPYYKRYAGRHQLKSSILMVIKNITPV